LIHNDFTGRTMYCNLNEGGNGNEDNDDDKQYHEKRKVKKTALFNLCNNILNNHLYEICSVYIKIIKITLSFHLDS